MGTLYNTLSFQFRVSVFTHFFAIFKTSQLKQIKAFPALLCTFPALKAWVLRIKTRKHRLGTLYGELRQTPALDHILDWNWGSWGSRCPGLHERRTHWLDPHEGSWSSLWAATEALAGQVSELICRQADSEQPRLCRCWAVWSTSCGCLGNTSCEVGSSHSSTTDLRNS